MKYIIKAVGADEWEWTGNGNCSFNCPNAALEGACDRWDLDPSDFGMEYTDCEECQYWDDNCTCEDCYVQFDPEYCPKRKETI